MKIIVLALCIVMTAINANADERRKVVYDPENWLETLPKSTQELYLKTKSETMVGTGMYPPEGYKFIKTLENGNNIYFKPVSGTSDNRDMETIVQYPDKTFVGGTEILGTRYTVYADCEAGEAKKEKNGFDFIKTNDGSIGFAPEAGMQKMKKADTNDEYYKLMCKDIIKTNK